METGIKRESMVFYESFFEAIKDLPAEQFKACACTILDYGLNGREPETNGVEKTIFILIKPQIDKNNQRWCNAKKTKHSEADKGASKKKEAVKERENIAEMVVNAASENEEASEETDFTFSNIDEEIISSKDDDKKICFEDFYPDYEEDLPNECDINANDIPEKCGEYLNVLLSVNERKKLINTLGVKEFGERLDFFSSYLKRKPNHRSACHYIDLSDWVGNAVAERRKNAPEKKNPSFDIEFEDIFENP